MTKRKEDTETVPHKRQSRREALRTLSLGGLGLATLPDLLALRSEVPHLPEDEKLGVALVGLGNYSNIALGPALWETKNCKLTGLVTGSPDKAVKWAQDYNIPQKNIYDYGRFDEIADNADIDIVYIVLPNFMHAEYTIRALEAGKHVICEKPMAMNPAECQAMIDASERAGKLLSVGYRLHYELHHQEVKRLAREKAYGPINFIEAGLAFHIADPSLWRLSKEKGGGGAIMDLGVYLIQGCRHSVGEEPIAVTAQGFTRDSNRFKDIYETILFQFTFPSGVVANCSTSYSSYVDRMNISCYQGYFGLNPCFSGSGSVAYVNREPLVLPKVNQQALHLDDFANSIMHQQPVRVPGSEGLQDLKIIAAILRSADAGGKRVEIG